jgi:hypothetical protein
MLEASIARSRCLTQIVQTLTPVALGGSLLLGMSLPASADPVVIQSCDYSPPPSANFIYGSPIATPIPVNPYTGMAADSPLNRPYVTRCNVTTVSPPPRNRRNSVLVNPTIVNPVIVNPGVVNYPVYPDTYIQRSRPIYGYPVRWR